MSSSGKSWSVTSPFRHSTVWTPVVPMRAVCSLGLDDTCRGRRVRCVSLRLAGDDDVDAHPPAAREARRRPRGGTDRPGSRSYFSRYPESPSPRVYGETAAADGLSAHEGHLGGRYAALADQPTDGTWVGSEVSPYGPALGVEYPHLDVDRSLAAARAAMPSWRDAGPQVRAAVCLEIVDAVNARGFELANAVMHTSGQPFVMAFQAADRTPRTGPSRRSSPGWWSRSGCLPR